MQVSSACIIPDSLGIPSVFFREQETFLSLILTRISNVFSHVCIYLRPNCRKVLHLGSDSSIALRQVCQYLLLILRGRSRGCCQWVWTGPANSSRRRAMLSRILIKTQWLAYYKVFLIFLILAGTLSLISNNILAQQQFSNKNPICPRALTIPLGFLGKGIECT